MPQSSSCLDFLRNQPLKLLKICLFLFTERRHPSSSKVKHLQFWIEGVLFLVRFIKNNTPPTSRPANVWLLLYLVRVLLVCKQLIRHVQGYSNRYLYRRNVWLTIKSREVEEVGPLLVSILHFISYLHHFQGCLQWV